MHLFAPHLPLLTDVLNRRFFYVLCVNTLFNLFGLWLLTGGQGNIYDILQHLFTQMYPA